MKYFHDWNTGEKSFIGAEHILQRLDSRFRGNDSSDFAPWSQAQGDNASLRTLGTSS